MVFVLFVVGNKYNKKHLTNENVNEINFKELNKTLKEDIITTVLFNEFITS